MGGVGFNAPIRIVPQASRWLVRAVCLLHVAIIMLALGVFAADPRGLVLVGASLLHWRCWLRELDAPVASGTLVLLDSNSAWWLQTTSGQRLSARLSSPPLVTPWLVVLALQANEGTGHLRLFLLPDSCPADDFRRLRVRLLWSAAGGRTASS